MGAIRGVSLHAIRGDGNYLGDRGGEQAAWAWLPPHQTTARAILQIQVPFCPRSSMGVDDEIISARTASSSSWPESYPSLSPLDSAALSTSNKSCSEKGFAMKPAGWRE